MNNLVMNCPVTNCLYSINDDFECDAMFYRQPVEGFNMKKRRWSSS